MIRLTSQQKRKLTKNPYVEKITEKHVKFTSQFKIMAVEMNLKGRSPIDIFEKCGFDVSLFPDRYFNHCLKRWRLKYNEKGKASLKTNMTGKHKTKKGKHADPDELTIEDLRALVEIQQETIEMLKKNRALTKKKEEA